MNRLTPEEQAVIDASKRKFILDMGGNNRAWRRAVANLIKAESAEKRKRERLIRCIAGTRMVA